MKAAIAALVAAPLALFLAVAVAVSSMSGGAAGGAAVAGGALQATTASCTITIDPQGAAGAAGFDAPDQRANAALIVAEVKAHVPAPDTARGAVVALVTAMQESKLRNLDHGDRDSLGLFQQRPSTGWGTAAQIMDPRLSTQAFLGVAAHTHNLGLLDIPGWASMPVTVAAQRVQASAFPFAYAKWEPQATRMAAEMLGAAPTGDPCGGDGGAPAVTAPGQVGAMLRVALAQRGKPYVWGATGPDSFDCSGLVVFSWRQVGHPLVIRTAEQMWAASEPVAAGSERAGDLLFSEFGGAGPGHVEIVVDPVTQTDVEAPHTGDVVKNRHYGFTGDYRVGRLKASAWAAAS